MKKITEILGLKEKESKEVAAKLNDLLASFQVYYQNLRGFHWNIKGDKFFVLHSKYEELYDDAVVKIDEIAERILTIGETPLHTFSDYIENSKIEPAKDKCDAASTMAITLDNIAELIKIEREVLEIAEKAEDEGTMALASDYISEQEKLVWMLHSFMK
ncbi:DNA starvation/stationary phase protection protein [Marinilabiliaceae bacterium ANBcel2]|nr:DNA starvation/stationary phase protection protein [Marinilabiliaceae bacterium ANBcel2]